MARQLVPWHEHVRIPVEILMIHIIANIRAKRGSESIIRTDLFDRGSANVIYSTRCIARELEWIFRYHDVCDPRGGVGWIACVYLLGIL